jgi:hypothetical protein
VQVNGNPLRAALPTLIVSLFMLAVVAIFALLHALARQETMPPEQAMEIQTAE